MGNVYGGSGNRWWVGLNIGSDQSTVFGTGSLLSPVGYESLPSGNAADDAKFAAAAAKDKGAASPATISVENVSWFNINGPYPTQKAANAAIPAVQKGHPAPGAISQAVDAATGQPQSSNSAGGLSTLLSDLTAKGTWLRVAKVVVGSAMIIVGLLKITGADQAAATAAKGALL
jgi:hypothetical protein